MSHIWQGEPASEVLLSAPCRSGDLREAPVRGKVTLPAPKLNCFTNHSASYIIKNPTGELFTYTPSGKVRTLDFRQTQVFGTSLTVLTLPQRVVVSAVTSPAQFGTKQLLELLFCSKAIGHCKTAPTMEHGFLVQVKPDQNKNSGGITVFPALVVAASLIC